MLAAHSTDFLPEACSGALSGYAGHPLNRNHYDLPDGLNATIVRVRSLRRSHPERNLCLVGVPVCDPFFAAMVSSLFSFGLIVAVIIWIASIPVRPVTVLLWFRLYATKLSVAVFLLIIPLSANGNDRYRIFPHRFIWDVLHYRGSWRDKSYSPLRRFSIRYVLFSYVDRVDFGWAATVAQSSFCVGFFAAFSKKRPRRVS